MHKEQLYLFSYRSTSTCMITRSWCPAWTKGNGELDIVNVNWGIYMKIASMDHVAAIEVMEVTPSEEMTNGILNVVLCYAATGQSRLELTYDRLLTRKDNRFFLGLP